MKYLDENRYERNYYRYIIEHKDIIRAIQNLANGLLMFKQDIEDFINQVYEDHKYLWSDERESIIQEFVNNSPLTVDIRDKFVFYDDITNDLEQQTKRQCIGPIEIRMGMLKSSFAFCDQTSLSRNKGVISQRKCIAIASLNSF